LIRFPEIAHEVAATKPDVILSMSTELALALKTETRTIPIVAWTGEPISAGIVSSLARPGGNITGLSIVAGPEIGTKRLQLFVEAVGKFSNVGLLGTPAVWGDPTTMRFRQAAEKMNVPLRFEPLQAPVNEAEYRRAFDTMQRDHVDAVVISSESENYTHRVLLGRLAREYRLPAICWYTDTVEAGALMSYGFDLKAGARRLAAQVVQVLNGGNPAEMPYFQETHFDLVINLQVAKELGLEIPAGLVARADKVIE
jgi:putative ABC transport system substrate-binding protein